MLTERQRQIAELVAQDKSTKAISRETGLAVQTVHNHIWSAAQRIPGDGRPRYKILVWFLGAQEDES